MKRPVVMLAFTLTVGIAVGVVETRVLTAQQSPLRTAELLKADVAGMEGKEVIVQFSEFAARAASGKHGHPGDEIAYVLEGSGLSEMEGKAPVSRQVATITHVSANQVHETKNLSDTAPLKLLIFRVHERGRPVTVRTTEPHFWR